MRMTILIYIVITRPYMKCSFFDFHLYFKIIVLDPTGIIVLRIYKIIHVKLPYLYLITETLR